MSTTLEPLAPTDPVELDAARTAVIAVDVQRLFTDLIPFPLSPPLDNVLPAITGLLEAARHAGLPVVLARTIITPDEHSDNTRTWPPFMSDNVLPGSPGAEFDPCLHRADSDLEVVKQRYSAFHRTNLDDLLRARDIDTLIICGLTTNVCVQSTIRDSWQHDYHTITVGDCCAETDQPAGAHDMSLAFTARNFGTVTTSDRVIDALRTLHRGH
jgi:ureidoacrylate peracid hydrolase